jgi:cell shape-determining protein MreC
MTSDNILDTFAEIISQLKEVPDNLIELEQLNNTEEKLRDILFQLQFELVNAQHQKNWEEVNKFKLAVSECQLTLNKVRAAIINVSIIGINQTNLVQMQKILDEIETARKTQVNIDLAIRLLGFLRRLFL